MTNFQNYKHFFPIFKNNPDLVYLDSGATTLKPQIVLDKMMEYYTKYSANIHRGIYGISEMATEEYEKSREKLRKFIGGQDGQVIFTGGTTEAINLVARGWGDKNLVEGEEIVVTEMEHHSNLIPWQELVKRKNLRLKFMTVNNYELRVTNFGKVIDKKTRLLAITQVSNVTGSVNPIKKIIEEARKINPKIVVVVDGAQAVAHRPVDLQDLGCDFYAFSGHKMYGPTGIGVLWAKEERYKEMEPIKFGGGMIAEVGLLESTFSSGVEKFEGGTPPIAEAIGMGVAVDFIEKIGMTKIKKHEEELTAYLRFKLEKVAGIKTFSAWQSGIVAMEIAGVHPHDVAQILADRGVCVRAGHHCAMPLHKALGVEATTRVSLGIYNTKEDIDKLVEGLEAVKKIFNI
ncbi:MAG: SufS family cysteine desulfurase [Candidatus Shapirobacteria bacterium]